MGFPIQKSAGQRLLAPRRSLSQPITSFIASCRQGIHQMLFSYLMLVYTNNVVLQNLILQHLVQLVVYFLYKKITAYNFKRTSHFSDFRRFSSHILVKTCYIPNQHTSQQLFFINIIFFIIYMHHNNMYTMYKPLSYRSYSWKNNFKNCSYPFFTFNINSSTMSCSTILNIRKANTISNTLIPTC